MTGSRQEHLAFVRYEDTGVRPPDGGSSELRVLSSPCRKADFEKTP